MKTKTIIALAGIAITARAGAINCGARDAGRDLGYNAYTYSSSYISGDTAQRCNKISYFYFFNDSSSSTNNSNLCPTELTRTLTVIEYIPDAYSSSIANSNKQLGSGINPVYGYQSCDTCVSGYNKILLARIEDNDTGRFSLIYGCGKCKETTWEDISEYMQSSDTCKTIDGNPTTEYRCANGFYGAPSSATAPCTTCPPLLGNTGPSAWGTSDAGDNTQITDCYLESGTYKDTTGTFKITSDCYYKI